MSPARIIDTQRLSTVANEYERAMLAFCRELAVSPDPERVRREMARFDFEETRGDAGAALGRIGAGRHIVLMEGRADAASAAAIAAMVYARALIHELGMYDDFTLWIAASTHPVFRPEGIRPDCVLFAEPTNLRIYRVTENGGGTPEESHPMVRAAIATYEALFELPPAIGRRTAGPDSGRHVHGIGFGPDDERHLLKAAQFYAAFPLLFASTGKRR